MKESYYQLENFEQGLQRLRELYFQRQNYPIEISQIKNFENTHQYQQHQKYIDNEIFQSLNRLENLFRQKENNNGTNNKLIKSEMPLNYTESFKKRYQSIQKELTQLIQSLNSNKTNETNIHIQNLQILQENLKDPQSIQDKHVLQQTKMMVQQMQKYLKNINQLLQDLDKKSKSIYKYNQTQYQLTKDLLLKSQNISQIKIKSNVSQSADYIDSKYQKKLQSMKSMIKKVYKKYQDSQKKLIVCKKNHKENMEKFFSFVDQYNIQIQGLEIRIQNVKQKLQQQRRRTSYLTQIKESKIINEFGSQLQQNDKNFRNNLFDKKESVINDQFRFYKSPSISLNNSNQKEVKSAIKVNPLIPSLFVQNDKFNQIDLEYHKKQSQYKDSEISNLKLILQKQKILEKSLRNQIKNLKLQIQDIQQSKNHKESSLESQECMSVKEDSHKLELIENLKYLEQIEIELRQKCEKLSQQIEDNQLIIFQHNKDKYKLNQIIINLQETIKDLKIEKSQKSLQQSSIKENNNNINFGRLAQNIQTLSFSKNIDLNLNRLYIRQENLQGKIQLLKEFGRQLKQQNINLQKQLSVQNVSLQNEKNKSKSLRQQLTVLSQKKINSIPESLKYIHDNENNQKYQQLQEIYNNQNQKLKLQDEKIRLNLVNIQELKQKEEKLIKKNQQLQIELDNLKQIENTLNIDKSQQRTLLLQQELDQCKQKIYNLNQQLLNRSQQANLVQSQASQLKQPFSDKNIQTSIVIKNQDQIIVQQKLLIEKNLNRLNQIKTQFDSMINYQYKDQRLKMKVEKLKNIIVNLNQNLQYYIQAYQEKLNYIQEIEKKENQSRQNLFEKENTIKDLQYQLQSQKAKESQEKEQKKAQKSGKDLEKQNEIFNIKKIIERIDFAMRSKDNSISKLKSRLQNIKNKLLQAKLSNQNYKSIQEMEFQTMQSKQKLEDLKNKKLKEKKNVDLKKTIQEKDDTINKLNLEHNKTYQSLDSKYTQVKNQLQSVQEQKEKLENVVDVLNNNKKNKEMIKRLQEYYDEIQRLKLENQKLQSEREDNLLQLNTEKINKKHFVQKMSEQQTNIDNLKSNLESVNKENQALKQQSLKLLSLTDQLENQLGIKIQSKNIQIVQKKLQDMMEEQQLSREFIKDVKNILQINKDQKETYDIIIKNLTNQGDKKQSLMYTSQIPIQQQDNDLQFQFQNKEISLKLKDLQRIIEELQIEKDKYKEIIEQLEFDKKSLKNDLTNLSNKIQQGQQQMNGINDQFDNLQQMKDRITTLMIKILQGLSKKSLDQTSLEEFYDLLQTPNNKKNAINLMLNQLIEQFNQFYININESIIGKNMLSCVIPIVSKMPAIILIIIFYKQLSSKKHQNINELNIKNNNPSKLFPLINVNLPQQDPKQEALLNYKGVTYTYRCQSQNFQFQIILLFQLTKYQRCKYTNKQINMRKYQI